MDLKLIEQIYVLQIKLGSVRLAKLYMKRVAMELHSKAGLEKDPAMDYMLLQGVRFAFRIHQVCSVKTVTIPLIPLLFFIQHEVGLPHA